MQVHDLRAPKGSRKRKRIVGRGNGSGRGKTSGRGENGQNSRPGRGIVGNLEGGQVPLIRRLPKVGFRSHRPVVYQVVKLESLTGFKSGDAVTAEVLKSKGLIKNTFKPYKILADGDIDISLTIEAYGFSKVAEEKIKKAGGKAVVINQKTLKELKKKKQEKNK